jgi:hypothetical protein
MKNTKTNTDWLHQAKWGLFFHFLPPHASVVGAPEISTNEWNRIIDNFDVEGLARQVAEVGAGYFIISIGQNTGFFLSPNETYDRIVGRQPSRLSHRDLVADLADALGKHGIRLMVYLPALAPAQDLQAVEKLKCTPPWETSCIMSTVDYKMQEGVNDRLTEFQQNWEAIIREWSLRWGKRVWGWWIDGGYYADKLYAFPEAPNFESFAAATKAGNDEALFTLNPGVKVPIIKHAPNEDYTAGELAGGLPVSFEVDHPGIAPPLSRFVDGAQYHLLTFLGTWWGAGRPRFSRDLLVAYTDYVNAFGGVITWDIPPTPQGRIPEEFMTLLRALQKP